MRRVLLIPALVLGSVVTLAVGSANGAGSAAGVVLQTNGQIVVAGSGQRGQKSVFGLARYRPNGSLDTQFGLHGLVTKPMDRSPSTFADAFAVALQPDGKIVAAGDSGDYASKNFDFRFAVSRYTRSGKLDASFGTKGTAKTAFPPRSAMAEGVALQPDGKIVTVGQRWNRNSAESLFALVRYRPDGSLDPTFGNGGRVTTAFTDPAGASAVALQPNGKLVVAGWTGPYFHDSFALVRYNADGSLDSGFGTGGKVVTSFPSLSDSSAGAVALQSDGKIVLAGSAQPNTLESEFALARYNQDGSLDGTFGSGGEVTTQFNSPQGAGAGADALVLQPDGKIIAAGGTVGDIAGTRGEFALARYTHAGSPDTGFGSGGQVTTSFGFSPPANGTSGDAVTSLALQPDLKIVAAGYSQYGPHTERYQAALARYDANGSLDPSFGTGGKVNTSIASCVVPRVTGKRLRRARPLIQGSQCKVGRIRKVFSRTVPKAHVLSERPRPGAVRRDGAKIRLTVSKGKRLKGKKTG
jgi:uncharacterized delta-60 repeat protein